MLQKGKDEGQGIVGRAMGDIRNLLYVIYRSKLTPLPDSVGADFRSQANHIRAIPRKHFSNNRVNDIRVIEIADIKLA